MLSTLFMLFALQGSQAAAMRPERVTIRPATSTVDVDGRLDEPAWASSVLIPLPYEVYPRENAEARARTECRATFDASALYFGCTAWDDPRSVRAYLTDRDRIGAHDRIVVFVDPFADARRAFFFNVNPLGVQQDGIFNGLDGSADLAWDAVWESAGRLVEDGYVVEMAIPFRSFPFPGEGQGTPWRFFIERNWPRSENVVFRSTRLDQSNACNLCQADELHGLTGLEAGLGVQVNPTVTATRTDRRESSPDGPLTAGAVRPAFGVNGRLRVTQDLTVNATVHPDFSQVEADAAQLDVNEQFSLAFPEKRPFFLDGTEVLNTPVRAAFTRSVSSPSGGMSLTGKLGPALIASLLARDDHTAVLVPGNQGSSVVRLGGASFDAFQRVRADVGGTGTAGLLYTGRFGDGYRNQVVAADGFVRLTGLTHVTAQLLHSFTSDPDEILALTGRSAPASAGSAGYVQIRRGSFGVRRRWFGGATLTALSPTFRADAGFLPQVDVRRVDADLAWNIWSNGAPWFTRLNFWVGGHRSETFGGRLNSEEAWWWFSYQGPRQTLFWVWPRWGRQYFAGQAYRRHYWEASVRTQPSDDALVGVYVKWGDEIDFANARGGRSIEVAPLIQARLGRHLDLTLEHRYQRLEAETGRVFTANLAQARVVYNFTPRAFLRAIVQLRHTTRVPEQYLAPVDRTSTTLFAQLLFSYRLDARTGLFVGLADNRAGAEPEHDPRRPLTLQDRTFFTKLSYAWRP